MDKAFEVHKLNERGLHNAANIAAAFDNLLLVLSDFCAEGREFAIVKTKLEEACFFAKKSMAQLKSNQQ